MASRFVGKRAAARVRDLLLAAFLLLTAALSLSRTAALCAYYGAPMWAYAQLPQLPAAGPVRTVCVGAEWYRFPSSFFLPSPRYRLAFVRSGFEGQLPTPFQNTTGAPPHFNDRNVADPRQYLADSRTCDFFVDWEGGGGETGGRAGGRPPGEWRLLASRPFLDAARSPLPGRALWLPGTGAAARNVFGEYALLVRPSVAEQLTLGLTQGAAPKKDTEL